MVYGLMTVRLAFPLIHYKLNKGYYLARCENLARPELRCNGKCVLALHAKAQLQAAQDKAASTPIPPMVPPTDHTLAPALLPAACPKVSDTYVEPFPYRTTAERPPVRGVPTPPPWCV